MGRRARQPRPLLFSPRAAHEAAKLTPIRWPLGPYPDVLATEGEPRQERDHRDEVDARTIDDYWTQAVEKLAFVHTNFALEPRDRDALMHGDAVLLAMISERLEAAED